MWIRGLRIWWCQHAMGAVKKEKKKKKRTGKAAPLHASSSVWPACFSGTCHLILGFNFALKNNN